MLSINNIFVIYSISIPTLNLEDGGSQPKLTANNQINIKPNQKIGIDTPINAINILKLSNKEFWCVAANIPAGIPTVTAKTIAKNDNSKVAGNLTDISFITGLLLIIDRPKSNLNKPLKKSMNCICKGSFRPIDSLNCAKASGDALSPNIVCAGSPGIK